MKLAILSADLIHSKMRATKPGGHRDIQDLRENLRRDLERALDRLNYDPELGVSIETSQGDDIENRISAPTAESIANVSLAAAISVLVTNAEARSFRFACYTIDPDLEYQPRIKTYTDIFKSEHGRAHHLIIQQALISALTDPSVKEWLELVASVVDKVEFTGEASLGDWVHFYCRTDLDALPLFAEPRAARLAEKTYLRYRDESVPLLSSAALAEALARRYQRSPFRLSGMPMPVVTLWENTKRTVNPDEILGRIDTAVTREFTEAPHLGPSEYVEARDLIKTVYERGPKKNEDDVYRLGHLDTSGDKPLVHGAIGRYYDSILTQFAIGWELQKVLSERRAERKHLDTVGTLPLREAMEQGADPAMSGIGRCAAMSVLTLLVFRRQTGDLCCLIRRRSKSVGVYRGLLHVVPSGMFVAEEPAAQWSAELNVWRELLEEVYDEEEQQGSGYARLSDAIYGKQPIRFLKEAEASGRAQLSAVALSLDLLTLQTEICTVLFVDDPEFVLTRPMKINWEYDPERIQGAFAVPWSRIDDVMRDDVTKFGIVPGGAVTLALGREWVRNYIGL